MGVSVFSDRSGIVPSEAMRASPPTRNRIFYSAPRRCRLLPGEDGSQIKKRIIRMKAKHFLPLLAAVIAACALILGLGGKKTTKGTLPPAVPSVSTTAPRQTEETETTAGTAAATATSAAAEPTETTEAAAETTKAETTVPETEAPATAPETRSAGEEENERDYVANKNTLKFHYPTCSSVEKIKPSNRWDFHGTREELIAKGYAPCKRCSP
ncbi:hypothetical protein KQI10_11405 [Pseudoflavonifractor sp. MSJ-30]|nr:hypothetical protein [Pseudoflavonifractor sp. MSJ-30]